MRIRKSYMIPNTHIVRNCSSERCKRSIHAHMYEVEIFFEADHLDNWMMIVDFGLTKGTIKKFLDLFKNSYSYWNKEHPDYIKGVHKVSDRWIELPLSPSAEALSLMILKWVSEIVKNTVYNNWEGKVRVSSVKVHETRTWYSEAFLEDLENGKYPEVKLEDFKTQDGELFLIKDLKEGVKYINEIVDQQIKLK